MIVNHGIYSNGIRTEASLSDINNFYLPTQPHEFAWLALKDPDEIEIQALRHKLNIPELIAEDVLHANQRPKMEEYGNSHLFLALRQYHWGREEALEETEVMLLVGPNYVVSVRHGEGADFARVRTRAQEEPELLKQGSGFVLYAILDIIVDRYFPVMLEFEKRVDAIENKMFEQAEFGLNERKEFAKKLHEIRRELGQFKQGVEPVLEITLKLFGGRVPRICHSLGEYFQDVHDHIMRILNSCERLRDDAALATQTNLALVTIEESAITKRLAAYAAIFAAVTLMAGVWGMNFENMPELKWKYGYYLALSSMIAVSWWLRRKFKKAGWL